MACRSNLTPVQRALLKLAVSADGHGVRPDPGSGDVRELLVRGYLTSASRGDGRLEASAKGRRAVEVA